MGRRGFVGLGAASLIAPADVLLSQTAMAQERPDAAESADAERSVEEPHSFELLVEQARRRAERPHERPRLTLAGPFADLTVEQYRAISFRADQRIILGEDQEFALELLPPGFVYEDAVQIALVRNGHARWLGFNPDVFDFGAGVPPDIPPEAAALTYSGFRLRHPLNRPDVLDEFLVFQGASHFRAVARGNLYGVAARGLAIATASANGEEFPLFTHFWLHEPEAGAMAIRIHALLDSPSVTGAYEFEVAPGADTTMEVRCRLFPRRELGDLGLAPLSSMYFFGPARRSGIDDIRDAVHDSDGLQIITGRGERLWRPLANPSTLQISGFIDTAPRAFGLAQRRRDYEHFEDASARFERRPSLWVEPRGDWGRGQVVLVEVPVQNANNENVFAFWRPSEALVPGVEHAYDYHLVWGPLPPDETALARVHATRSGALSTGDGRSYAVDFNLGELSPDGLTPAVSASRGSLSEPRLVEPPRSGLLRVLFEFEPEGTELSEFRLILQGPDGPASETWLHRWTRA